MKQGTGSGTSDAKQGDTKNCIYCLDDIPRGALICRTCSEPQDFFRRAMRFISAAATSLIAIGSLWFAYLQHEDAKIANEEANQAKAGEKAQVDASQAAVHSLYSFYNRAPVVSNKTNETLAQKQMAGRLLSTNYHSFSTTALQKQLQSRPSDTELRQELLLRQVVEPATR